VNTDNNVRFLPIACKIKSMLKFKNYKIKYTLNCLLLKNKVEILILIFNLIQFELKKIIFSVIKLTLWLNN